MFNALKSVFFGGTKFSDKTAKNRLQMVLVQDRSGLSPTELENFQKEIMEVIGRFFILEKRELEIDWQRNESCIALVINTPVVGRAASEGLAKGGGKSTSTREEGRSGAEARAVG